MRSLLLVAALSCAISGAFAATPIEYVPAETPYVITSTAPMPAAAVARMQSYTAPIIEAFKTGMKQGFLKAAVDSVSDKDGDAARLAATKESEEALRFFTELSEIYLNDATMLKAGFKPQAKFAIYGIGAIPVLRLEISDASKASQTVLNTLNKVVELSKAAEAKKPAKERKTVFSFTKSKLRAGEMYRLGEEKVQPFVLIEGNQLVFSVLPQGAKADLINMVVPAAPTANKALTGKLSALQARYGYHGYGMGFVDFAPLSNMWMGRANKLEAAIWAASSEEKLPNPNAECKKEMSGVISNMPRLTLGYTELTGSQFTQKMVLELAPSIAKSFAGTTVPMPAYGNGAAFKFGMSTDPLKAMNAMRIEADKIVKVPYTCESLLSLNESAAKLKEGLANPMLGMAAMVKGFGISLESIEMDFVAEKPEPKNMTGNLAVFTDQPEALLAMAQAQIPQLATTTLVTGAKPVKLDQALFNDSSKTMLSANEGYAAMTKSMLIVGAGKDRLPALSALLNAPASSKGEALEFGYGKSLLIAVMTSMEKGQEKLPEADREGFTQMIAVQKKMLQQLDSLSFTAAFTASGLEFQGLTRFSK